MLLIIQVTCGFMVSCMVTHAKGSDPQVTCESDCRYTAYAADAECTNRGLNTIPTAVDVCRRAQMFDCSYNSIVSLQNTSFIGFWQMWYLRLEENQIATINPGTFLPIRRTLRLLNISRNHLTSIAAGTFVNMTRLDYLLLSYNQISIISPNAFQRMTRLSKLYLGDNSLTTIDPIIFRAMPNLKEINLRNNRIFSFDITFIEYLGSLQKIFAHNNSIEELTGEVATVQSSLILINLSINHMDRFNCTKLENLHGLSDVYLSNNSLQTLQGCRESQISAIHLDNNPLNCDCDRIQEVARWSRTDLEPLSPTCWTPESVRGIEVQEALIGCHEIVMMITTTGNGPVERTLPKTQTETDHPRYGKGTETESPPTAVLTTTVSVNIPIIVKEESLDEIENMAQVDSESFFSMQNPLHLIIIVICVFLLIVLILLFCILKIFCCQRHSEEEQKQPKRERAYFDVESGQDVVKNDIHSKSNRCCCCPWYLMRSGEGKGTESKKGSPDSMRNHNYERVVTPSPRENYPRQRSSGSESSHTTMIRILPNYFSPASNNGMFNPGIDTAQCTCGYDCADYASQYSYTDSCSDESYQMENQLNEMCDCHHGDMGGQIGAEECERMLQVNTELPPPYTPTDKQSSCRQNPLPLPQLPGCENEPIYIPHTQV